MRILIDARLYGLENAGLGRYVVNLINELTMLDNKNKYIIILRRKYFDNLDLPNNFEKVLFDHRHYSFMEQVKLPFLINKLNPDLVHFPHFNIPILYRGNFVVTIHDILMHNQRGFEARTLNPCKYVLKRLGYKFIFSEAVRKSKKVIVPSNAVKNDLLNYYKIDGNKVEVIYEG